MPQEYPKFLNNVNFSYDILDVPSYTLCIQDEAALIQKAKEQMSSKQKDQDDVLPILRHSDKAIVFISQSFLFLSKRVRDFADCFLIKQFSLMQWLKENAATEFPFPELYKYMIPRDQNHVLFISSEGLFSIEHTIPEWYLNNSDKYGKAFKSIESKEEAVAYAKALFENDYTPKEVRHLLRLRHFKKPLNFFENIEKLEKEKIED